MIKFRLYYAVNRHAIQPRLTHRDFRFLRRFGILRASVAYQDGYLLTAHAERIEADLNREESVDRIIAECLGTELQNAAIGFCRILSTPTNLDPVTCFG